MYFAGLLPKTIPSQLISIMEEHGITWKMSNNIEMLSQFMQSLKSSNRNQFAPQNQMPPTSGHHQPHNAPQWDYHQIQGQAPIIHPSADHQAAQQQPLFYGNSYGHPQVPPQVALSSFMIAPHSQGNLAPNTVGAAELFPHPVYPGFNENQPASTLNDDLKTHQPFRSCASTNGAVATEHNIKSPARVTSSTPLRSDVHVRNIQPEIVNEDSKTGIGHSNEIQFSIVDSASGLKPSGWSQETNDAPDVKPIIQHLIPSAPVDSDDVMTGTNGASQKIKMEMISFDDAFGATDQPSTAKRLVHHSDAVEGGPGLLNTSEAYGENEANGVRTEVNNATENVPHQLGAAVSGVEAVAARKSGRVSKPPLKIIQHNMMAPSLKTVTTESVKNDKNTLDAPKKSFMCFGCGQAFKRKGNLLRHLDIAHSTKPKTPQSRKRKAADDAVELDLKKQKKNEMPSVLENTVVTTPVEQKSLAF